MVKVRKLFDRKTVGDDAMAGLVLGIEGVPDGLASGLLAGLNPVAGLYAYLYGLLGAAFFTSTAFMAVQGTGAMAIIVADVGELHASEDPVRSLVTLSLLTGVVMLAAGFLGLGAMLRFVGGSVSASPLIASAGAKTRAGLMFASAVMALVILLFSGVVEYIPMPLLAGLLIVVGVETVKPAEIESVRRAS